MALGSPKFHLLFPGFLRSCGRLRVWHVEEGRYAAPCCCPRFTLDVCFLGKAGLTEVNMLVDDAGKNKTPRGIYVMVVGATGCSLADNHVFYMVVVNDEASLKGFALIDNRTMFNDCPHYYIMCVFLLSHLVGCLSVLRGCRRGLLRL